MAGGSVPGRPRGPWTNPYTSMAAFLESDDEALAGVGHGTDAALVWLDGHAATAVIAAFSIPGGTYAPDYGAFPSRPDLPVVVRPALDTDCGVPHCPACAAALDAADEAQAEPVGPPTLRGDVPPTVQGRSGGPTQPSDAVVSARTAIATGVSMRFGHSPAGVRIEPHRAQLRWRLRGNAGMALLKARIGMSGMADGLPMRHRLLHPLRRNPLRLPRLEARLAPRNDVLGGSVEVRLAGREGRMAPEARDLLTNSKGENE